MRNNRSHKETKGRFWGTKGYIWWKKDSFEKLKDTWETNSYLIQSDHSFEGRKRPSLTF